METVPGPESTASVSPAQASLAAFRGLFPGIIQDGVLDAARLGEALGVDVAGTKEGKERFGLMWAGKNKAVEALQAPSFAALVPDEANSVSWEKAQNVFIEGDNLEVLKIMQNAYNDQIKFIYLDPPYNTGKDFIYNDDFSDPAKRYLEVTGQLDPDGNRLTANPELLGRKHSNWLTMMYPRLVLTRNLLTQDGVIAVSIDDNEVANLKLILDEIFGPQNFQGQIHWRRRHNQPNDPTKMIALVAEHVLVYSRDFVALKETGVGKLPLSGDFSNPDGDPRGPWGSKPWKVGASQSGSKYDITTPAGDVISGEWMGERSTFERFLDEGRMYFPKAGKGAPRKKYYQFEREAEGQSATNWWPHDRFGHNQGATSEVEELFEAKNVFSNPKPTSFLISLMQVANVGPNDLVADFFAGSGSLQHAVLKLNSIDGGHRRAVSVTLKEEIFEGDPGFHLGFRWISDLCVQRIKLAIASLSAKDGLRMFRVGSSSFNSNLPLDHDQLLVETTAPNARAIDQLWQIALTQGVSLDAEFQQLDHSTYRSGKLIVCLARELDTDAALRLPELLEGGGTLALLEDSLRGRDSLKANLFFACKKANITFKTF